MQRRNSDRPVRLTIAAVMLTVLALPGLATADSHESSVAAEIEALIMADNRDTRANLEERAGAVSKEGSLEFWSSGGLMQSVAADAPVGKFDRFAIVPKHINVIELPGGEAAVALYYTEGSLQPKGGRAVEHYMTRVMHVFVKEDGKWVTRAAHWSPVSGGGGTSQTSID